MEVSEELKAKAERARGEWVYELDWEFAEDEFVPPEAVKAAIRVTGELNNAFEVKQNKDYRPIIEASRSPREYMLRAISPSMLGRWISEIDPDFDDQFPDVPTEGITGSWYLDERGRFPGLFRPNPKYDGRMTP